MKAVAIQVFSSPDYDLHTYALITINYMEEKLSPLIRAGNLHNMMNRQDVVIVDARGGPDAFERYRKAHLKGAIFADLEKDLSEKGPDAAHGGRHPLPMPEKFGSTLTKLGIDPDKHVLTYDDKGGANAAARFWWMLKAAGHKNVQVIDGGFSAILKSDLPVSDELVLPQTSPSIYPIKQWKNPLADIEFVTMAQSDQTYLIVDVREDFRYKGESEPIDLIAGHIPGAINLPYTNNLGDDGLFRSPETLAKQYDKLIGGRSNEKVIVHCGSGVTACHTLLAMHYAGIKNARLYVGSWGEWSRNPKPIALGKSPGMNSAV